MLRGIACVAIIITPQVWCFSLCGCGRFDASSESNATRPGTSSRQKAHFTVDFGSVTAGSKVTESRTLESPGHEDLAIARIETSCDCLAIDLSPTRKEATRQSVDFLLDLSKEPDFVGSLEIRGEAFDATGYAVFTFVVNVTSLPTGREIESDHSQSILRQ